MNIPPRIIARARKGFTLLEVVISMGILALLAGSVYAVVSSAISASQTATTQQLIIRRLDAFVRAARDTFLNLPPESVLSLETGLSKGGEAESRLLITKAQEVFGIPSLGGGSLVLAAKPRADGTRTMTLLTIPARATDKQRQEALSAPGIPLLPKLRKPRWSFLISTQDPVWKEELVAGSPRPLLVRLQGEIDELPNPLDVIFYLPPTIAPAAENPQSGTNTPNPTPSPTPPSA
jgi:prepilin-type N-terminal cleavage/methylation domain-containing protein